MSELGLDPLQMRKAREWLSSRRPGEKDPWLGPHRYRPFFVRFTIECQYPGGVEGFVQDLETKEADICKPPKSAG